MENLVYQYEFLFDSGKKESFIIQLRKPSLEMVKETPAAPPAWTRLENHRCPNCPLDARQCPQCPVALNLAGVIDVFAAYASHEKVEVVISSEVREYRKRLPLADGLSSLIGIFMTTSGCPVMDQLRPMVYTHLPFATADETVYRAISMFLMAEFFRRRRGLPSEVGLIGLADIYDEVRKVNVSFSQRLSAIIVKDANITALVNLDCYAILTSSTVLEDTLGEFEVLFKTYLK